MDSYGCNYPHSIVYTIYNSIVYRFYDEKAIIFTNKYIFQDQMVLEFDIAALYNLIEIAKRIDSGRQQKRF
jgi:hypothetical protein